MELLRLWSPENYFRLLVRLTCLALFACHVFLLARPYFGRETLSEASLALGGARFPHVSLCFPLVVCAHNNRSLCPQFKLLFNQSLPSVSIRCKRRQSALKDCSRPARWFRPQQKCFTWAEPEVDAEDPLVLHFLVTKTLEISSFELFIHAQNDFPLSSTSGRFQLQTARDSHFQFFATEEARAPSPLCSPDAPQAPPSASGRALCLLKCSSARMFRTCDDACVSRFSFIAEPDFARFSALCAPQSACNNRSFFETHVLSACHATCLEDCTRVFYHVTERTQEARDLSEANVTVSRAPRPDLRVRHVARLECTWLWALVGGAIGLWAAVAWLIFKCFEFLRVFIEFLEIYCF